MEEKRIWSEVNKIIRNCERRRKRGEQKTRRGDDGEMITPRPVSRGRRKNVQLFMRAIDDIMAREHEVNIDLTLKGDMARAFHITLAIGRYLWNQDEDAMISRIVQSGIEQIISEHSSDLMYKEMRKLFKPLIREILEEMEDGEAD